MFLITKFKQPGLQTRAVELTKQTGWANQASKPAAAKTLAEIQREEERRSSQVHNYNHVSSTVILLSFSSHVTVIHTLFILSRTSLTSLSTRPNRTTGTLWQGCLGTINLHPSRPLNRNSPPANNL